MYEAAGRHAGTSGTGAVPQEVGTDDKIAKTNPKNCSFSFHRMVFFVHTHTGSGNGSMAEPRTRDREFSGSSPGRNFFSRVNFLC